MRLADLTTAKDFLRYDGPDNDPILETALDAASAHILDYLDVPIDEIEADQQDPDFAIPANIEMACIVYAGILLRDPTGAESEEYSHGYMPRVVMNLVYKYRRFGMAPTPDWPTEKWWLSS